MRVLVQSARRNSFECLSEFTLTQATQFLCRRGLNLVYLQEVPPQIIGFGEYPITDGARGFPSCVHTTKMLRGLLLRWKILAAAWVLAPVWCLHAIATIHIFECALPMFARLIRVAPRLRTRNGS